MILICHDLIRSSYIDCMLLKVYAMSLVRHDLIRSSYIDCALMCVYDPDMS